MEALEDSQISNAKVAVFDLDGTLTYKDTYLEFLKLCLAKQPWRLLLGGNLVFYFLLYKTGIRSNHWLKARFLKTLAVGIPSDDFNDLCKNVARQTAKKNLKPKAVAEIDRLRNENYKLILATASFDFYVLPLFEFLNMDHLLCTHAAMDEKGCITGEIAGKNCIGSEKSRRVALMLSEMEWGGLELAYSDDRVDQPLLAMAETAFVVDPGMRTRELAIHSNWQILVWR